MKTKEEIIEETLCNIAGVMKQFIKNVQNDIPGYKLAHNQMKKVIEYAFDELLSQQKQEMVEEIEKELIWVGDELVTEGDYGDFNKVLLNLKQKLNK